MIDDPGGEDPRQPVPAADATACSRPDTWRTGGGTPRSAARRKVVWSRRSSPTSTWTGWISFVETVSASRVHPREPSPAQPRLTRVVEYAIAEGHAARRPGHGAGADRGSGATLPSQDPNDPGYRRLRYVRYADDFLLGFTGPKAEAEEIKRRSRRSCATTSSWNCPQDKTLITHARTQAARFLGYEITVQHADTKITRRTPGGQRQRSGCACPRTVIRRKCAPYLSKGKPGAPRRHC